ncbi:MAG: cation:proton antiporter [Lachnospiraceae bacterium]|nr:cation:proton antiporter [Lachnospiraceae bacterium]
MEAYEVLKDLAIIILFAKFFGIVARKLKAPQVVGEIVAGLIIGPCLLGLVNQTDFIAQMAEIGVILLMFSAGLETNLHDLLSTGVKAFFIALLGVIVPLIGGTLLYMAFYGAGAIGSTEFFKAVFIGVIMTATSVSITVEVLRELGKLGSTIGTTIISAAIIDDVIGIVVLTVVLGYGTGESGIGKVLLSTGAFFVLAVVFGIIVYKIFKKIDKRYPHTQRIPIIGLALCFVMAYVAEKYFGIADITGAYAAGIILCNLDDAPYIERKMNINSYMLFGPVFFCSIGLKTDISGLNLGILVFSIAFVITALMTKIIGCGLMAKVFRMSNRDALRCGVGMMTRGEVALIVATKGLNAGMLDSVYFTSVILLIITSSIITPILLKMLFSEKNK